MAAFGECVLRCARAAPVAPAVAGWRRPLHPQPRGGPKYACAGSERAGEGALTQCLGGSGDVGIERVRAERSGRGAASTRGAHRVSARGAADDDDMCLVDAPNATNCSFSGTPPPPPLTRPHLAQRPVGTDNQIGAT